MWINNRNYLCERVTDPRTGLTKTLSVKISGESVKARQEANKKLQEKIKKLSETDYLFFNVINTYLKEFAPVWKPSTYSRLNSLSATSDDFTKSFLYAHFQKVFNVSW